MPPFDEGMYVYTYYRAGKITRFIFCVLCNLTEFTKVHLANLLISQYKHIIPAQITKLIPLKCSFEHKIEKFYVANFSAIRYMNELVWLDRVQYGRLLTHTLYLTQCCSIPFNDIHCSYYKVTTSICYTW